LISWDGLDIRQVIVQDIQTAVDDRHRTRYIVQPPHIGVYNDLLHSQDIGLGHSHGQKVNQGLVSRFENSTYDRGYKQNVSIPTCQVLPQDYAHELERGVGCTASLVLDHICTRGLERPYQFIIRR
jgi:hypothetical protein